MHSEVKAYHYTSHSDAPCIGGFPSSLRVELCLSLGTRAHKIGFLHCSYLPLPIEVTQGLPAVEHERFVLSPHRASSQTAHSILLLKYGVDSVRPKMLPVVVSQGSGLVLLSLPLYMMPHSLTKHQSRSGLGNLAQLLFR